MVIIDKIDSFFKKPKEITDKCCAFCNSSNVTVTNNIEEDKHISDCFRIVKYTADYDCQNCGCSCKAEQVWNASKCWNIHEWVRPFKYNKYKYKYK